MTVRSGVIPAAVRARVPTASCVPISVWIPALTSDGTSMGTYDPAMAAFVPCRSAPSVPASCGSSSASDDSDSIVSGFGASVTAASVLSSSVAMRLSRPPGLNSRTTAGSGVPFARYAGLAVNGQIHVTRSCL